MELPLTSKKDAWPWVPATNESISHKEMELPVVSLITPSLNQSGFIEATIRSVLLQNYPKLEYVVLDGESSDGSVETIRKYEPWLTQWKSEKDNGQAAAINSGLLNASGEIFGWLNSDDFLAPGALFTIARMWQENRDAIAWAGAGILLNSKAKPFALVRPKLQARKAIGQWNEQVKLVQPACFFSARAFKQVGGLNPTLWCGMDVDLWLKLSSLGEFACTNDVLAYVHCRPGIKSQRNKPAREAELVKIYFNNNLPHLAAARMVHFVENRATFSMLLRRVINLFRAGFEACWNRLLLFTK
jgi:glycosyltransferase involved in cell wall biosynthesis